MPDLRLVKDKTQPKISALGQFDVRYAFGLATRERCVYTTGEWFDEGRDHASLLFDARAAGLLTEKESDLPPDWPVSWIMSYHGDNNVLTLRVESCVKDGLTEVVWALEKFVGRADNAIIEWFPKDYDGGGPSSAILPDKASMRAFIAKHKKK